MCRSFLNVLGKIPATSSSILAPMSNQGLQSVLPLDLPLVGGTCPWPLRMRHALANHVAGVAARLSQHIHKFWPPGSRSVYSRFASRPSTLGCPWLLAAGRRCGPW